MSNDDTVFAQGRLPERTYISRTFVLDRANSSDHGEHARFVYKVFDEESGGLLDQSEGEEWIVRTTPGGRKQLKLLVVRGAGRVKELWIQNIPAEGTTGAARQILNLKEDDATRLIELVKALESIPVEGGDTVRIDDRDLFADPDAAERIYRHEPSTFAELISSDAQAADVIAIAARRRAVHEFRRMLDDDEYFNSLVENNRRQSDEDVWQQYFENHPWMLGANLAFQLLTSWSDERLEQVVAGSSLAGSGKRTDALFNTSGRVRSMVFAEIKTHRTLLLAGGTQPYRSGCWAPSSEVAGGVAQVQGTVRRAVADIGARLQMIDDDGADMPGDFGYLFRPRSYLVVGNLKQLQAESGADHQDKIRSFELFRRELIEPEIITFGEVLARSEWIVDMAELTEGS